MTYEEFLQKLKEIGVRWTEPEINRYNYHRGKSAKEFGPAQIESRWCSGEQGGGSCWDVGESHHYSMDGEPEPEFTELDDTLAEFCPNISFIQYKQLCSKLINRGSETENEYYGNYTTYGVKTIKCRELFEYLVQKELIQ